MKPLTIVLMLMAGGVAGGTLAAPADVFEGDGRLDVPVSILRPCATNARILRELTESTRVNLIAVGPAAGYSSVLAARDTPLRDVLRRLASAGGYEWRRTGEGALPAYTLSESPESLRRAAEAQQRRQTEGLRAVDRKAGKIAEYVRKFTDLSVPEAQAVARRLREAAEALPISRQRFLAEEEWHAANQAADPEMRGPALAYQSLRPAQRAELAKGSRVLMAVASPGAVAMPDDVAAALRAGRVWLADRQKGPRVPVLPDANEILSFTSTMESGALRVAIRAQRYGEHARAPALQLPGIVLTPSRVQFAEPAVPEPSGQVTAEAPEVLLRPVEYVGGLRKRTRTDEITFASGLTPAEILRGTLERTPWLRVAGDCPWRALTPDLSARPITSPRTLMEGLASRHQSRPPLGDVLDLLARRGGFDVHVARDGWVTVRTLRPHERAGDGVDGEWLRSTFGDVAEGATRFTAPVARRAAAGLTYGQATALGRFELGFLGDQIQPWELQRGYHGWRHWGP